MKNRFFLLIIATLLVFFMISPSNLIAKRPANPSMGHAKFVIPPHAIEVAPGVFSLGTGIDKGRVVEGYAIIFYKKGHGKPSGGCNNDGKCQGWEDSNNCDDCIYGGGVDPDTSNCYGFMAKGAKWKVEEPYVVNPLNSSNLHGSFILDNIADNIAKWEDAAGTTNIIGNGSLANYDLVADLYSPDDKNEVYFADIQEDGAIGVTIVWGIWRGPPSMRELVEWDQVYDDVDFGWSNNGGVGKMDFENIATHELGHSVGMDDLYDIRCSEQTMYGYASEGETVKRDLAEGDITGVYSLYNE